MAARSSAYSSRGVRAAVATVSSLRPACSRSDGVVLDVASASRSGPCGAGSVPLAARTPRACSRCRARADRAARAAAHPTGSGTCAGSDLPAPMRSRIERARCAARRWRTAVRAARRGWCDRPWRGAPDRGGAIRCCERRGVEIGQVAGEHQPGRLGLRACAAAMPAIGPRCPRARRRSADSGHAPDRCAGRAAPRRRPACHAGRQQVQARVELRAALVARGRPCRAACACFGRRPAPGRRGRGHVGILRPEARRVERRLKSRLPPLLASSRTPADLDVVRQRLAHVVDGQRRDRGAGQRFHLDAGPVLRPTRCTTTRMPPGGRCPSRSCSSPAAADGRTESARGCAWRPSRRR